MKSLTAMLPAVVLAGLVGYGALMVGDNRASDARRVAYAQGVIDGKAQSQHATAPQFVADGVKAWCDAQIEAQHFSSCALDAYVGSQAETDVLYGTHSIVLILDGKDKAYAVVLTEGEQVVAVR